MEYRRFGSKIVARFDRGEEILDCIEKVARAENIKLASVSALGALSEFTAGVYNLDEKQYHSNNFTGFYEIVSLVGTINTKDDDYYGHFHISCGDSKGQVFGGHLNRAVVGATCEMVIDVIDGRVERQVDPDTGLNIYKFL